MEKHNKEFLYRIEYILGDRDKHPWGRAIGLKNARIQSIFQGKVPTAGALEIIHRAENANLNWLLTGEGPHFVVESWRTDEQVAQLLKEWSEVKGENSALYLLTDGTGQATLVSTVPTVHLYDGGVKSTYTEVRVFPYLGQNSIKAASGYEGVRLVNMDSLTFTAVSAGWKGPVHLLGGLLDDYTSATASAISEAVGRYEVRPQEEEALLTHYRHLPGGERRAVITVVESMSRSVEVMQNPPGNVVDPDSVTEDDAVGVDGKASTANKVHSDD